MNCADFEKRLTRLVECPDDAGLLDELRRHAAVCGACRGSRDLVELLALPPAERDIAAPPPAGYWEDFNRRVESRRKETHRPGLARRQGLVVAAAVLVVAVVGGRALGPSLTGKEFPGEAREEPAASTRTADDPPSADEAAPEYVAGPPGSLTEGPPLSSGTADGAAAGGWLFPGTDELDDETVLELLDWLHEQNARAEVG